MATVLVAFAAIWLTAPRPTPGNIVSSPSPFGTAPTSSAAPSALVPSASGLPVLLLNGALPEPARVMVSAGDTYRAADLATGTIGVPATPFSGSSTLVATADGWACICANMTKSTGGLPSELVLRLATITPDGAPDTVKPIRTLQAELDPTVSLDAQSEIVDVSAVGSVDGGTALVAWSARQGAAGWSAGIDVVDLVTGAILDSVPLPVKEPAAASGRATTRPAPHVTLSPTGAGVLVSSFWYVGGESFAVPPSGSDYWMASFDGRTLTSPQARRVHRWQALWGGRRRHHRRQPLLRRLPDLGRRRRRRPPVDGWNANRRDPHRTLDRSRARLALRPAG